MQNASTDCWETPIHKELVGIVSNNDRILDLSNDVIRLVNDGIYSLYSLNTSPKLILITDSREFYLLNENGTVEKKLETLAGYELKSPIRVKELNKYSGFKVNYA